jgi:hypothetical protein
MYEIRYLFGRKLNKPSVALDMVEEKFSVGTARNATSSHSSESSQLQ